MKALLLAATVLGSVIATSAGAVTFAATDGGTATFNASAVGAQYTFETATTGNVGNPTGFNRTGGQVMANSVSGLGANPFGAPENNTYLYVTANTSSTIAATAMAYQTISFYIGSIDARNSVDILGAGGAILKTYTGTDLAQPTPANGQQTLPGTNRLLTFTAETGQVLTGIRFSSAVNSLEADNVRFTNAVPEPATWAMMLLGFGMIGGAVRYRRRSTIAVYA